MNTIAYQIQIHDSIQIFLNLGYLLQHLEDYMYSTLGLLCKKNDVEFFSLILEINIQYPL